MGINWQDIFYITSSLAMIMFLIAGLWFMWVFYNILKLVKNLTATAHKWENIIDEIRSFKESVKLNFSKFMLKVLGKETKKI